MSEKQLDFLNIFEPSKHEIENIDEGESENKEVLEDQKVVEKKEDLISDSLIKREKEIKKEAEIKLKRLEILRSGEESLKISDFADIMPEIKAYETRMLMLRAAYEAASPGDDKSRAYQTLVNPDMYDEEVHRDSARLYLKYLEVSKREMKQRTSQLKLQKKDKKIKTSGERKANKQKTYEEKLKSPENESRKWVSGRDRAVEKFE